MRYRPFGRGGQTVSVLSLALDDAAASESARVALVYAALEAGINAFELQSPDPDLARALGKGLQAVDRRLVLVSLRLPATVLRTDALIEAIESPLLASRLGRLDAIILTDPGEAALSLLATLEAAQGAGRLGLAGVAGLGAEEALATGSYRLYAAPYHLASGWADRNRLKQAVDLGAVAIGNDWLPPAPAAADGGKPMRSGFLGLGRRPAPIERTDAYAFLRQTPQWAADEICLAYALLEPSLASIVIRAGSAEDVERLALTPERELPTGLPAQIEMARFAAAG